MPQEFRLILKNADQPGYAPDIECYVRRGGYEALRKALALPPLDLWLAHDLIARTRRSCASMRLPRSSGPAWWRFLRARTRSRPGIRPS